MFNYIFNKYKLPLELRIIIFDNLERKDLFNLYKNLNVSIEIQCLFNKQILDEWIKKKINIEREYECTYTKINSLCFNCTDEYSKLLLLSLIDKYNQYKIELANINTFFDVREIFFKRLRHGKYSFINKYYECVKLFNTNSEIIVKRKKNRINSLYYYLESNQNLVNKYNHSKKELIEILTNHGIRYYKSWNKTRLVNAYYQNV